MPDRFLADEDPQAAVLAVMVVVVMDLLKVADPLADRLKVEDPPVDPLMVHLQAVLEEAATARVVEVLVVRPVVAEDPQVIQEVSEMLCRTPRDQAVRRSEEPG